MPRFLKITLLVLGALVALFVIAAVVIAARFNPNDYKPLLVQKVQESKQRTLDIPGDIKLSFFPSLGVQLGQVSLSERKSRETFASMDGAQVSLALMPLLRREVIVDRVKITGLKAVLKRDKDGRMNIDDLAGANAPSGSAAQPQNPPQQPVAFDIAGLSLERASITLDDAQAGRRLELTNASVETGRLKPGALSDMTVKAHLKANKPVADADLSLKGQLMLDPVERHYAFKGLAAELNGKLADFTDVAAKLTGNANVALEPMRADVNELALQLRGKPQGGNLEATLEIPRLTLGDKDFIAQKIGGSFKLEQGERSVQGKLAVPSFEGSAQAVRLPGVTLTVDGKQGGTAIKGTLSTPLEADFKTMAISLPRIAAQFDLPNPRGGALKLSAQGAASANLDKHSANATLAGMLDESKFDVKLNVGSFSPLATRFDVAVDQINADRYRAAAAAPKEEAKNGAGPQAPLDFSSLAGIEAQGSLRVGALQAANVKASNLRVDVKAGGGRVELSPMSASLYQGTLAGSASLTTTASPRIAVKQTLSGVSLAPLLQDAIGKAPIEGHGNVGLDVTAQGGTVSALKKALGGSARFDLRDGAVRGVNIAQAIRKARSALGGSSSGGQQAGTGSQEEKTDFSEFSGTFHIANGVAHNDDLSAKSPLLRVGGAGDVDLGQDRLDYLVKATVVASLQGQGGPELQALRGQTIPVRLKGPFTSIGYSIDFGAMAQEAAKAKLEEKKGEVLDKAKKQLGDKLKGLFGK